jgi:hypothetical protein
MARKRSSDGKFSGKARLHFCFCLFWLKTALALIISTGFISWYIYKVVVLHSNAVPPGSDNSVQCVYGYDGCPFPSLSSETGSTSGTDSTTGSSGTPTAKKASCNYDPSSGYARLEPPANSKMYMGFSMEWLLTTNPPSTPQGISSQLNYKPSLWNAWLEMSTDKPRPGYDQNLVSWYGQQVALVGGILELTMQPVTDLDNMPNDFFEDLAKQCAEINKKVPIMLRFGHEMNGKIMNILFKNSVADQFI